MVLFILASLQGLTEQASKKGHVVVTSALVPCLCALVGQTGPGSFSGGGAWVTVRLISVSELEVLLRKPRAQVGQDP